jgi:hypothetical protein
MKPEMTTEFTCYCCDEYFDGKDNDGGLSNVVLYDGHFIRQGDKPVVEPGTDKWRHVCNSCFESNDNVLYCALWGDAFLCSEFAYTYVDHPFDDYALDSCLELMGWEYDEDSESYIQREEQTMAKHSDFYWHLEKGERRLKLQLEDGGEAAANTALEKKIYHRIEEAGGDTGDPNVVNVYTRLVLIDEGLLSADYVL